MLTCLITAQEAAPVEGSLALFLAQVQLLNNSLQPLHEDAVQDFSDLVALESLGGNELMERAEELRKQEEAGSVNRKRAEKAAETEVPTGGSAQAGRSRPYAMNFSMDESI